MVMMLTDDNLAYKKRHGIQAKKILKIIYIRKI